MPKRLLLALAIFAVVLLGGCAKFDATAGIDENYNSVLQYHVSLSVEELSHPQRKAVQRGIDTIVRYYTEAQGFTLEANSTTASEKLYDFTLTKSVSNSSYSQAVISLKEMLTNEQQSVFMKVAVSDFYKDNQGFLSMEVELDIEKIIALSTIDEFSASTAGLFWDGVEKGEGTLTLFLPASEIDYSTESAAVMEGEQAVLQMPIIFTGTTKAELATRVNGVAGLTVPYSAEELAKKENILAIAGVAICLLGIGILAVAIIKSAKGKKAHSNN